MAKTKPATDTIGKKYVPKKEVQAYAIAALGQGLAYSCMSSYITDYYMNVLTLNAWFVILLMLFARVWDAVNDPLMGMIIDRHTTKKGRMKPYPLKTAVPIGILTILLFINPGFDTQNKSIWLYVFVAVSYVAWGMTYTVSDVPFWSIPNLMTPNPKERGNLISNAKTIGGIGTAVTIGVYTVLDAIFPTTPEGERTKFAIMAITMAVIGMTLYRIFSAKVKERVQLPNATKKKPGEVGTLKRIFTCKPLMLVVLAGSLSFGRYMLQAAAPHVARYSGVYVSLKGVKPTPETYDSNIVAVALFLQILTAIGMFGAMIFLPKLYKKYEYKHIMIVSCLVGFVSACLTFVIGWKVQNLIWCAPLIIISSIPLGVINNVAFAMVCDCLDFMEWKTGFRNTGLGSACQTFVNQLGNALATVMIIGMYLIVGLDPATLNAKADTVVQAALGLGDIPQMGMFALVTIVPGLSLLLCAIPLFFYDLTGKKKEKVFSELAELRKQRGIEIEE